MYGLLLKWDFEGVIMKGTNNKYSPKIGEYCSISAEHCDDINGYVFSNYKILWQDDTFILYGNDNCYPNLSRREHIIIKEIK